MADPYIPDNEADTLVENTPVGDTPVVAGPSVGIGSLYPQDNKQAAEDYYGFLREFLGMEDAAVKDEEAKQLAKLQFNLALAQRSFEAMGARPRYGESRVVVLSRTFAAPFAQDVSTVAGQLMKQREATKARERQLKLAALKRVEELGKVSGLKSLSDMTVGVDEEKLATLRKIAGLANVKPGDTISFKTDAQGKRYAFYGPLQLSVSPDALPAFLQVQKLTPAEQELLGRTFGETSNYVNSSNKDIFLGIRGEGFVVGPGQLVSLSEGEFAAVKDKEGGNALLLAGTASIDAKEYVVAKNTPGTRVSRQDKDPEGTPLFDENKNPVMIEETVYNLPEGSEYDAWFVGERVQLTPQEYSRLPASRKKELTTDPGLIKKIERKGAFEAYAQTIAREEGYGNPPGKEGWLTDLEEDALLGPFPTGMRSAGGSDALRRVIMRMMHTKLVAPGTLGVSGAEIGPEKLETNFDEVPVTIRAPDDSFPTEAPTLQYAEEDGQVEEYDYAENTRKELAQAKKRYEHLQTQPSFGILRRWESLSYIEKRAFADLPVTKNLISLRIPADKVNEEWRKVIATIEADRDKKKFLKPEEMDRLNALAEFIILGDVLERSAGLDNTGRIAGLFAAAGVGIFADYKPFTSEGSQLFARAVNRMRANHKALNADYSSDSNFIIKLGLQNLPAFTKPEKMNRAILKDLISVLRRKFEGALSPEIMDFVILPPEIEALAKEVGGLQNPVKIDMSKYRWFDPTTTANRNPIVTRERVDGALAVGGLLYSDLSSLPDNTLLPWNKIRDGGKPGQLDNRWIKIKDDKLKDVNGNMVDATWVIRNRPKTVQPNTETGAPFIIFSSDPGSLWPVKPIE